MTQWLTNPMLRDACRRIRVKHHSRILCWCLALSLPLTGSDASVRAQAPDDPAVTAFDSTVAPILSAHCLSCHRDDEPKGGLDLSWRTPAARGGESGRAFVPGDADNSLLWERIAADEMPPTAPLSADEKEVIRQWIADGATWGTDPIDPFAFSSERRAGYDWWSLQPLRKPPVPPVAAADQAVNDIDRFILAALQNHKLGPSPRADARTLVRRLYADLIGLPAPVQVIESFSADPSASAWNQLVENLLSSEHYGERWARHWMGRRTIRRE